MCIDRVEDGPPEESCGQREKRALSDRQPELQWEEGPSLSLSPIPAGAIHGGADPCSQTPGGRGAQGSTEKWGWLEINQPIALDDYYLILLSHRIVQEWLSHSLLPSVFITRKFSVRKAFHLFFV